MLQSRVRPHTRLRFLVAALVMAGVAALAGAPPSQASTPADPNTCGLECFQFASALHGGRFLDEPTPSSTAGSVVTDADPTIDGWGATFPNMSDQQHGEFQLVSFNSNLCLTAAQTDAPLTTTPCGTNLNQYWTLVKTSDSDSDGDTYYELRSADRGKCATISSSSDTDGAVVRTQDCTAATNQEWLPEDGTQELGPTAAWRGGAIASDFAWASRPPQLPCADPCVAFASDLSGARLLDETSYPTRTELAVTNRWPIASGWHVSFPTDLDKENGRFQLIDSANQLCLTSTGPSGGITLQACSAAISQAQYWTFAAGASSDPATGASYYELVAGGTGQCATIHNSADADGTTVEGAACSGQPSQRWLVEDANAASGRGTNPSILAGTSLASSYLTANTELHADEIGGKYSVEFNSGVPGSRSLAALDSTGLMIDSPIASGFQVNYETTADASGAYFQLVRGTKCVTNPGDGAQITLATCVNQDGADQDTRQQWYLTKQSGGYWLRSKYDSNCATVDSSAVVLLHEGDAGWEKAKVLSKSCNLESADANQIWTLSVDGYGSVAGTPSPTTLADALASQQIAGATAAAATANNPSTIKFCNHGAFVAEGVISIYQFYQGTTKVKESGPWSTNTLAAGSCQSFTVPAGQGVVAQVSLHDFSAYYAGYYGWQVPPGTDANTWTGVDSRSNYWTSGGAFNDITAANFDVAAPYTSVEFDINGTSCYPGYSVSYGDAAGRLATQVTATPESGGCTGDANRSTVAAGATGEAAEGIEDLVDGFSDILRGFYPILAGL